MRAFLIRRLMILPITFIGITLLTFCMLQLAPGNPVNLRLMKMQGTMSTQSIPEEVIAQTKAMYGLDKPLWQQYLLWVKRVVLFDFGDSYKDRRPVLDKIGDALPVTIQLNLISIAIVYTLSIPLGVFSATRAGSILDSGTTVVLFILYSLPTFWLAMLLIFFFTNDRYVNLFPAYGLSSIGAESWPWHRWIGDRLWHMVLPVVCLTYADFAYVSRFVRSDMLDTVRQDYIRTARAYGFGERTIAYKHALRNSLISMITLVATLLPALLGGSVIIEQVFSVPGMGKLFFDAIGSRDYPLVMAITTLTALLTMAGLIIQDILYALADPRVRLEGES